MELSRREIEKLIKRDKKIYEKVYLEYCTTIVMYIDAFIKNREDAKDMAADIFINLPELLKNSYKSYKGSFKKWLMGLVRNKIRDYSKQARLNDMNFDDEIENNNFKYEDNKFKIEELKSILNDEEYKIVVLLYIEDFKSKEVAKMTNQSLYDARLLKKSAFDKIKKYYKEFYIN